MYCAIMGDIIKSREIIEGRGETQERFKSAIKNINDKYANSIKSNFTIMAGDGFYGLINSCENLLNIILEIRLAIAPNQIRIGIGIGSIDTKIEKNNSELIDGRANSTAKEAIDYLSENEKKYESVYRTTFLKVDSRNYDKLLEVYEKKYSDSPELGIDAVKKCEKYEKFINTIFCACSGIEKKWEIIHAATMKLKANKYTQREIAQKLGISQPAVQKRLISSDYYLYEHYMQVIESGINEIWEEVQNA